MPVTFPSTRCVLWDHQPQGPALLVHPVEQRAPSIILEEKALRLAQYYAQQKGAAPYNCCLSGYLTSETDTSSLIVTLDNFQPSPVAVDGTELSVSLLMQPMPNPDAVQSREYSEQMKVIWKELTRAKSCDMSCMVALRAHCAYNLTKQTIMLSLDLDLVIPSTRLSCTPIKTVPIAPTALSKNLAGPRSLSEVQGTPKAGYLTMDHTRKLLLVLESDPKATTLPLVGIWVSGVMSVTDPFVWTFCLKYLHSASLGERVCVPPEAFLVVVYSSLHSRPEFFECTTASGKSQLQYELHSVHEVLHLSKEPPDRPDSPLSVELTHVTQGPKADLLDEAVEHFQLTMKKELLPQRLISEGNNQMDDIVPRTSPAPHNTKAPVVRPCVPEVSLIMEESVSYRPSNGVPQRQAPPVQRLYEAAISRPGLAVKQCAVDEDAQPRAPLRVTGSEPHLNPLSSAAQGYSAGGLKVNNSLPGSPNIHPEHQPPNRSTSLPNVQRVYNHSTGQYDMVVTPPSHHMGQSKQHRRSKGQRPSRPHCNLPCCNPHQPPMFHLGPPQFYGPAGPYGHNGYPPMAQEPVTHRPPLPKPGAYPPQAYHSHGYPTAPPQRHPAVPYHTPPHRPSGSDQHMANPQVNSQPVQSCAQSISSPTAAQTQPSPTGLGSQYNQAHPPVSSSTAPQQNLQQPAAPKASRAQPSPPTKVVPEAATVPGTLFVTTQSLDTSGSTVAAPHPQGNVYELLKAQDEQLRSLREQLAQLLAKQNSSSESGVSSDMHDSSSDSHDRSVPTQDTAQQTKNMCSIAVNTSMWWPAEKPQVETVRPQEWAGHHQEGAAHHQEEVEHHQINGQNHASAAQAQPHMEAHPVRVLNSAHLNPPASEEGPSVEVMRGDETQPWSVNDTYETYSLGDVHLTQLGDKTIESVVSQMIIDMPEYARSPEKSSSRSLGTDDSPVLGESVSMYENRRQDSQDANDEQDAQNSSQDEELLYQNQKEFYQNLIGNLKQFLEKHKADATPQDMAASADQLLNDSQVSHSSAPACLGEDTSADITMDVKAATLQHLQRLGIELGTAGADQARGGSNQSTFFMDPALLPKIQYVSMLLDTDSDRSSDIDALAMKYLNDEQLSELAKYHTSKAKGKHLPFSPVKGKGISTYGMSASDMSFATKKYLERYGLAKGHQPKDTSQSEEHATSDLNDSQRSFLKVQNLLEGFYARTSRENSENEQAVGGEGGLDNYNLCERLNHLYTTEQNEQETQQYGAAKFAVYHKERQANARQQPFANGHRRNSVNSSSNSSEHSSTRARPANRILDIERLKELPKLL